MSALLVLGGRSALARSVVPLLRTRNDNYLVTRALSAEDHENYLSRNFRIIVEPQSLRPVVDVESILLQLPKRSMLDEIDVVSFSGASDQRLLVDMSLEDIENVVSANFTYNALWASCLIRRYRGKRISFVFVSSSPAIRNQAGVGTSIYSSSKHALKGLAATISSEYGKLGTRANTLALGLTGIGMGKTLNTGDFERILGRMSTGKLVAPDQVASAIEFLFANDACSGTEMTLDSGLF